jgi:rod shape determining protein RodA
MIDRRLVPHIDWSLIMAVAALACIGLATIYSVTWDRVAGQPGNEFWMQLYALPVAFLALFVCLIIDYRSLAQRSFFLYLGLVAALIYVAYFGAVRGGSRRWIDLGPSNLQPSEFARMTLALALAMFFGDSRRSARSVAELVFSGVILAVPFYLIMRQPDLGTAATLLPVYLGVVYLAGLRLRWIAIAAVVFALLSPVIWSYGLQDYQKERIEMFIDPS